MFKKKYLIFLFLLLIGIISISYVNAEIPIIKMGVPNITVNVNNSNYWNGLNTPADFLLSMFDNVNWIDADMDFNWFDLYDIDEITANTGYFADVNISGDLNVSDTFFVDGKNKRVGIGTATPAYTLDVNGNTRVTSDFWHTGGTAYLYAPIRMGNAWTYAYHYGLIDDGYHIAIDGTNNRFNNNLIITNSANWAKDHDHDTLSTNPTIFVHSATNPDTDNTQWLSLTHNKSDGIITVGKGDLYIKNATLNIDDDLVVTGITYTNNITLPNGGKLWDNATCTFLSSPDGSTVTEVCNA